MLKALVLADINKKRIEEEFLDIQFDYKGYAVDYNVLPHSELVECINDYDILISEFDTIGRDVLDNAKRLKLLICCRGGIQTVVDVEYAKQKGIVVRNTPGRNAVSVAEYVIGQIISFDRGLFISNQMVQDDILQGRKFSKPKEYGDSLWGMDEKSPYHLFRGKGLENIVLGVVGFGKVGSIVAKMGFNLGMKVLVHDKNINDYPDYVTPVSFEEILKKSDFVSVHCDNKDHKEIFTLTEFNLMKSDAVFLNAARGDLVNEDDLIKALNGDVIGGAILDVTIEEPLPVHHKLLEAKNLVITPHIAGATDIVIDNGTSVCIHAINEYLWNQNIGMNDKNVLVILAAGLGSRYNGNVPKQYTELNGEMLLSIVLNNMKKSKLFDKILLVVSPDKICEVDFFKDYNVVPIAGGKDRAHSFQNAIDYVEQNYPDCRKIVFHEAARPLVKGDLIDQYFQLLDKYDYVETCTHIADSIGSKVVKHPVREDYFLIQAPEAYRFEVLKKFYDCESKIYFAANQFPETCKGYQNFDVKYNLKLTTPEDKVIIEALLKMKNDEV